MKKIIISIMMMLFFVTGCGSKKEDEPVKTEEKVVEKFSEKEVSNDDLIYATYLPMYNYTDVKKTEFTKDGVYANTWIEFNYNIDGVDINVVAMDNGYKVELFGNTELTFTQACFMPSVLVSNDPYFELSEAEDAAITSEIVAILTTKDISKKIEYSKFTMSFIISDSNTTIFINKK